MEELNKLTVTKLKSLCKQKNIKNYSKLKKDDLIKKITGKEDKIIGKDIYSIDVLQERFYLFLGYYRCMKQSNKNNNISCRLPAIPEDISENIIKFILHLSCDKTSIWTNKYDLRSEIEDFQECKCFTSDGPISFSPTSEWNCVYFLDGRKWYDEEFKLYKFPYKRTSDEWKNIKVNNKETFQNHCDQKRRPRITWKELYRQRGNKFILIFDGTLKSVFK